MTAQFGFSFDPDQAGCFVEPDLWPNCLQKFLNVFRNSEHCGKTSSIF